LLPGKPPVAAIISRPLPPAQTVLSCSAEGLVGTRAVRLSQLNAPRGTISPAI